MNTPRTDNFASHERGLGTGYYQALDFARQLENELAESHARETQLREALEYFKDWPENGLSRIVDYALTLPAPPVVPQAEHDKVVAEQQKQIAELVEVESLLKSQLTAAEARIAWMNSFDGWMQHPYTKVQAESIKNNYVPKGDLVAAEEDAKGLAMAAKHALDYALSEGEFPTSIRQIKAALAAHIARLKPSVNTPDKS